MLDQVKLSVVSSIPGTPVTQFTQQRNRSKEGKKNARSVGKGIKVKEAESAIEESHKLTSCSGAGP